MSDYSHEGPLVQYPFHLAFPVDDLEEARRFYGGYLGCEEGRSSMDWIDFNLFGHQIVAHKIDKTKSGIQPCSDVDGHQVPVRHFGVVLPYEQWLALSNSLKAQGIEFLIRPCLRFEGTPGEQYTFFVQDPSGNALEFKSMTNPETLFSRFES